ncbi:MAG: enoyl-CoA hydratase/isomerase family protein [Roseinatronobacter sp.]
MSDILIRIEGRAGRVTLNRPQALNALTYDMCMALDAALQDWAQDDRVAVVMLDAVGERGFCSGGDIAEMYATGTAGDYSYGRRFWRDEYRMNARLAGYGKPVVSFLQGFTMGGGVGVGCHATHRIVGESSQIAMPENAIGLVPDVGGSLYLARAGALGAYLGMTGARMGPGDAVLAGFADRFIPQAEWEGVKAALVATGEINALPHHDTPAPALAPHLETIAQVFALPDAQAIARILGDLGTEFGTATLKAMTRNAPLSVACTREMLARLGPDATLHDALAQEYRFTHRAMEKADFLEGIRAAIIDKDRNPRWRHASIAQVTQAEVAGMLADLGPDEWTYDH